MIIANITRKPQEAGIVIGTLTIAEFKCNTLEPLSNLIPTGSYTCMPHYSHRLGEVYWIRNNDQDFNNKKFYIHIGNFLRDTRGCVLIGVQPSYNLCVLNSRYTFNRMQKYLNKMPFNLTIQDHD